MEKYDVIIVGVSFAGLAVASKIKSSKVLLIDSKPIGANIKSACGTILKMVLKLGFDDCVLQIHKKIVLHTANPNLTYHLKSPFCVVDGKKFCRRLFKQGKAEFLQANVLDFDGLVLRTNKGNLQADIFVDASGPNSALTKSRNHYFSFGLETIVDYQEKDLHFWYEPKVLPKGVFWLFPQGKTSRIGVGSYKGETKLRPYLEEFMNRFSLKIDSLHGGYFPHRLREPVINKVFLVGDSAGQCLPLTGEGIRPAIVFGQKCGEIIERILAGNISLAEGLKRYQNMALSKRKYYQAMYWLQQLLISIPESLFYPLAWLASKKPITSFVLNNYLRILEDKQ